MNTFPIQDVLLVIMGNVSFINKNKSMRHLTYREYLQIDSFTKSSIEDIL